MNFDGIRHFTRDEFGYADGVEPARELVLMLDSAREIAGVPFRISSGIRSREHNDRIGGAPNSAHVTGEAVDIRTENTQDRFMILDALLYTGFTRIGIYNGHIHVDTSKALPQNRCWTGISR